MSSDVIDARDFPALLERQADEFATYPLTRELKECSHKLRRSFSNNFARGGSPEGAWPERKVKALSYGPTKGWQHPLLILSGDLYLAATSDQGAGHYELISAGSIELGVDLGVIPYARAQNYGDRKRNLPQREFFVADDKTLDECEELIAEGVFVAFAGVGL